MLFKCATERSGLGARGRIEALAVRLRALVTILRTFESHKIVKGMIERPADCRESKQFLASVK